MPSPLPSTPPAVHPRRDAVTAALIVLAVASSGIGFVWARAYRAQIAAVQSELLQLARTAATLVDGDLHQAFTSPAQTGSPEHLRAITPLVAFHKASHDLIYVSTAILRDGRVFYVLGTDYLYHVPGDNEPAGPIFEEYTGPDTDIRRALTEQTEAVNAKPIAEKLRTYMSAYAPIRDSHGHFVGVVCLDMWVRNLETRLATIRNTALTAFLGVGFLSALTGLGTYRSRRATALARLGELAAVQDANAARCQAEEANRAKSAFLAMMSHEIRTPMNGVVGMASLLSDTTLTAQQRDYLHTIESSSDALLTIINDILDYSKIEAGRIELEANPFDLRQCIEEALDLFTTKAAERSLELAYSLAPEVPGWIVGDVTRLRQILVNLVGNAVKFTPTGEVEVAVRVEAPAPALRLHVAVRDTGIGIPADRLDRLFKSFSQVDRSTTRQYGGTGLGLAISQKLAVLMGGRMWVESTVGRGSTFQFTIAVAPHQQSVRINVGSRQPALEGLRVLIVDDNATNRQILCGQTRSWGLSPTEADSSQAALDLIAGGGEFDLALLDYQMPGGDGEELARRLRKIPRAERLPLVLLSSAGRRPTAGLFAASVAKPVKPALLLSLLGELFSRPATRPPIELGAASVPVPLAERCPLKVLVADDNPVNLKVAQMMLLRLGYRVNLAANGRDVLEALRLAAYDVIFMDVEMPELDGLETTRQIRARGVLDRPWIIALTANAMKDDRERARAAGMNDYLTKPFRPEEIEAALVHAFEQLVQMA
jgi:signal transduction histidine kinase/CheY-like chemotaxis protein